MYYTCIKTSIANNEDEQCWWNCIVRAVWGLDEICLSLFSWPVVLLGPEMNLLSSKFDPTSSFEMANIIHRFWEPQYFNTRWQGNNLVVQAFEKWGSACPLDFCSSLLKCSWRWRQGLQKGWALAGGKHSCRLFSSWIGSDSHLLIDLAVASWSPPRNIK